MGHGGAQCLRSVRGPLGHRAWGAIEMLLIEHESEASSAGNERLTARREVPRDRSRQRLLRSRSRRAADQGDLRRGAAGAEMAVSHRVLISSSVEFHLHHITKRRQMRTTLSCAVLMCVVSSGSYAQGVPDSREEGSGTRVAQLAQAGEGTAAPRATEAKDQGELLEVVVSAQKRLERLQDVPVPVTSLSASALADASIGRSWIEYSAKACARLSAAERPHRSSSRAAPAMR